jgi:F0F1-type ATP synthase delta subunit
MTTIELKKSIIQRIAQIDDSSFLKAIKTIIDSNPSESLFYIPEDLKIQLKESRKQIRKGKGISNEDLNNEILEWLEERK